MLKKGGGGWSVVRVPDSALVPEGAGVRAAGGLYVGVCVYEACGFVCGVFRCLRAPSEGTCHRLPPGTLSACSPAAGAAAQVNGIRAIGGTLNHCPAGLPDHLAKMPQISVVARALW